MRNSGRACMVPEKDAALKAAEAMSELLRSNRLCVRHSCGAAVILDRIVKSRFIGGFD